MTKKSKENLGKKAIKAKKADLNLDEKNSNFANSQGQNSKAQNSQWTAKTNLKDNLKANSQISKINSRANFTSQKKPKAQNQNLNETNSQSPNSNELNSQGQSVVSAPLLSSLNSAEFA